MTEDTTVRRKSEDNRQPLVASAGKQDAAQGGQVHISSKLGGLLEDLNKFIYVLVGICFLIAALVALGSTFWSFSAAVIGQFQHGSQSQQETFSYIIFVDFLSGLLLVLIIMEVLGTVIHYLKSHETSLRPFLVIGIVSGIRSILSVGARLSIGGTQIKGDEFTNSIIELAVSAFIVLALGITLRLLGNLVEERE